MQAPRRPPGERGPASVLPLLPDSPTAARPHAGAELDGPRLRLPAGRACGLGAAAIRADQTPSTSHRQRMQTLAAELPSAAIHLVSPYSPHGCPQLPSRIVSWPPASEPMQPHLRHASNLLPASAGNRTVTCSLAMAIPPLSCHSTLLLALLALKTRLHFPLWGPPCLHPCVRLQGEPSGATYLEPGLGMSICDSM